jgi:hypothetical protein
VIEQFPVTIASCLLDLALALRMLALEAIGNHEQALVAASALREQLRPGLLPRILVEEMISRSETDAHLH